MLYFRKEREPRKDRRGARKSPKRERYPDISTKTHSGSERQEHRPRNAVPKSQTDSQLDGPSKGLPRNKISPQGSAGDPRTQTGQSSRSSRRTSTRKRSRSPDKALLPRRSIRKLSSSEISPINVLISRSRPKERSRSRPQPKERSISRPQPKERSRSRPQPKERSISRPQPKERSPFRREDWSREVPNRSESQDGHCRR